MSAAKPISSGEFEREQEYYLSIAEFVIKIKISASEQVIFREIFLENFRRLWRGVMLLESERTDFEIECDLSDPAMRTIVKKEKLYMEAWATEVKQNKIRLANLSSLWVLQLAIRQAVMHLLKGQGFLLHASAVRGESKGMQIFLAESGGGKSTTAKRASELGLRHVADDSVIVRKIKGGWRCYGPGMVEKQYLASSIGSSRFALNCLIKSASTRKYEPSSLAEKLSLVMKQVWLFDEGMSKATYEMVVSFVKAAKIYQLELSLKPEKLGEVLDED